MYKPISNLLHTFLLLVLIGSGSSIVYTLKTTPKEIPLETVAPARATVEVVSPSPTPIPLPTRSSPVEAVQLPDSEWSTIQPGLERRVIPIYNSQNQPVESVYVFRLDQKRYRLDIAFDAKPKTLETWQKETSAALVVNGGYFSINSERYSADGLTVLNGQVSGRSFQGYGGMLAIRSDRAELRWLIEKPYTPGESLQAALQSFPILVRPGGLLGFGPEREDQAHARRTVIAQDKQGRILFIVTPQGYFTLHQLSSYLTESDLDLDIAINLDGGGSTGLLVDEPREIIPSKVLLPFVILAYAR
jgi:hypothetical protein